MSDPKESTSEKAQRCRTCMGHGWTGSRHANGVYSGHYHCPCGAPCAVDRAEGCSGASVNPTPPGQREATDG